MITRYIIVSIISGILFGVMDSLINANPLAVRLNAVYKPIARKSINCTRTAVLKRILEVIINSLNSYDRMHISDRAT